MKTVTYYEVDGHPFKSKELATFAEAIVKKYPDLDFCFLDDKIILEVPSYEGKADINITENDVELNFFTHDPSATTEQIVKLEKQGICWELSRGLQFFVPKERKSLLEDFELLYKYVEKEGKLV